MPSDLLNRLQDSKLRAMNEFVERCSSGPEDQTAALAEYLVEEGLGFKQDLVRFWDYCWANALKHPMDREKEGKEIRAVLERGAGILKRMAAMAGNGLRHHGERLILLEEQARDFPVWVEECMAKWNLLSRPGKPLDSERLARAQAALARGECVDVAELIARLEQGGSIS